MENWLRHAVVAGIAWLLCYVWFKRRWWRRKIIQRDPLAGDVLRELKWSVSTAWIYGLVRTLTLALGRGSLLKMYRHIETYGWLWFWVSIVVTIFVHAAWFYWTHRLMHPIAFISLMICQILHNVQDATLRFSLCGTKNRTETGKQASSGTGVLNFQRQ